MAIFVTGSTGYIGSYVVTNLLRQRSERLALLVRARDEAEAQRRLWKSLQLHMDFAEFEPLVQDRCDIYLGDLVNPKLGLDSSEQTRLIDSMESVIHVAASLNRKSAKACFNVNLRGTLHLLTLARAAADKNGLKRFSDVSTVAVCGERQSVMVNEAEIINWDLSDYDPYARTKKFCESMIHEILPDVPTTVFRPSIVLGDSRFPETTQFDMVRAFVFLAQMPLVPLRPEWRADIVPADYVGRAIAEVHVKDAPKYDSYNLSSGAASLTYRQIVDALATAGLRRPLFAPWMAWPFKKLVDLAMDTPRSWGLSLGASLMKVFWPYLEFNTVFDNARIVEELGDAPVTFDQYASGLLNFARGGRFQYPYKDWPEAGAGAS